MAYEIVIPRLGWSMEEGTFVRWIKKHGEQVHRGDPLFELEGEKASQEIESIDEGILCINVESPKAGDVLKVGAVIGQLLSVSEQLPSNTSAAPPDHQTSSPSETSAHVAGPSVRRLARELGVDLANVHGSGSRGRILSHDVQSAASQPQTNRNTTLVQPTSIATDRTISTAKSFAPANTPFASPRARRIARELGIDWRQLNGTGANGRIREADVRAASVHLTTNDSTSLEKIPITSRRRTIAQRMVISRQQTVPVTLTTKADTSNLVNLREQLRSASNAQTVPSYQDIIMKLVAQSIKAHPIMSGRWEDDAIVVCNREHIHMGMAVDTEEGLLVPVIRDVNRLSLQELAIRSRQLVDGARLGKLQASDMTGSVFTITNLGAFGIDAFTPVINYPEVAILGLGAIRREPVLHEDGRIVPRSQMTLSLTFDHRVVDGAPAARFLQTIVSLMANPSAHLLLETTNSNTAID